MKKYIFIALLFLFTPVYAANDLGWMGNVSNVWTGKTTAPSTGDDANDGYQVGDSWVDETNDVIYYMMDSTIGSAVWKTGGGRGIAESTAVDVDITSAGEYHATAQTIFKVDLSTSYAGKTFTFSNEVTGTTLWFVDALSVGEYGGAAGVSIYNNSNVDFLLSVYFPTATSGYVVDQSGSASYDVP